MTAVIERDGEDVIWRDFAWQTGAHADLERDGYHGWARSASAAPSTAPP